MAEHATPYPADQARSGGARYPGGLRAVAPAEPASASVAVGLPLSPALVANLQRHAGNGAVTKVLNTRVTVQRDDPKPKDPFAPGAVKQGQHQKGEQVGTWGVYAKTPLKIEQREDKDFGNQEAAIAYCRGLG